jgi:hypothetical protein
MNLNHYIKKRLEQISESYPGVTFRYGFDRTADVHIVEITPQNEYDNNNTLNDEWIDLSIEILSKYPDELVSFVSADSILKIENVEFTIRTPTIPAALNAVLSRQFGIKFNEYMASIVEQIEPGDIQFASRFHAQNIRLAVSKFKPSIMVTSRLAHLTVADSQLEHTAMNQSFIGNDFSECEENDYPMAA